jgi:uncharacterized protein (DUF2249 family)
MNQANATLTPVDVRALECTDRHALIFSTFGGLAAGQGLELINDHDPKPLRNVFQAQYPGKFGWEYLEQGPRTWRVAITKLAPAQSSGSCCGSCGGQ